MLSHPWGRLALVCGMLFFPLSVPLNAQKVDQDLIDQLILEFSSNHEVTSSNLFEEGNYQVGKLGFRIFPDQLNADGIKVAVYLTPEEPDQKNFLYFLQTHQSIDPDLFQNLDRAEVVFLKGSLLINGLDRPYRLVLSIEESLEETPFYQKVYVERFLDGFGLGIYDSHSAF